MYDWSLLFVVGVMYITDSLRRTSLLHYCLLRQGKFTGEERGEVVVELQASPRPEQDNITHR